MIHIRPKGAFYVRPFWVELDPETTGLVRDYHVTAKITHGPLFQNADGKRLSLGDFSQIVKDRAGSSYGGLSPHHGGMKHAELAEPPLVNSKTSKPMPHSSGASHELLWECEGTVMMLAAHLSCFIDNKLTAEYGTDHLYSTLPDGNYRFEADIRTKKENRCADNPARARKTIREATFEQTIDVICREDLYASLFQDDLLQVFPKGRSDCIAFFKGLIEQRNRVNETDQISVRDAEQIVSDSNRISDLLRKQCFDFKMATDPEFRKKYASLASRS